MSTKIQILNEKQVDHFVDVLLPKLTMEFDTVRDVLREKAKEEKDNFVTHAEVIKLKAEQEKTLNIAKKLIAIAKQLKEVDEKFYISRSGWYGVNVTTEEELIKLEEEQVKELDELLLKLSKENLFVNEAWQRRENMTNELRARLSMTAVNDFDSIEEVITASIDVYSFFKTKITNDN